MTQDLDSGKNFTTKVRLNDLALEFIFSDTMKTRSVLRMNEQDRWKRKGFDGSQVVLSKATSSLLRTFCSYKVKLSLRVIVEWVWPVPRRFTCRPLTVWHVAGARVCVCARALLPRPHPPPPPAPAAAHSRRLSSLLVCKWSLPLPPGARTPRPPAAFLI